MKDSKFYWIIGHSYSGHPFLLRVNCIEWAKRLAEQLKAVIIPEKAEGKAFLLPSEIVID